jgi:hypothetical protein
VIRRLSVEARGRVRVGARFATAIGRDATWTMADRCRSTVTSVKRATVLVTDAGARHAAAVRKGQHRISSPKRSR